MTDFDNLAGINENFDTIKTLLNSIRAQGILNTSDVDKLLSGINMKLEKLNTEEDIDLIKIFLSELKQNLEERHGLLVSKFGAIESLFASLLKNTSEMLKSSEVKELFDIVATNLSVFSREVVSQKESLTDISLRLDALRSDDSQKKDIIKNITILKSDIERLNNGFDSIVINLNENFKTLVKTITMLDKTEHLDKFTESLSNIEMSSNTVLSALQMLDKKAELVEIALKDVATKDDMAGTAQKLFELNAQSHELTASINNLNDKYVKFDTLAEKIDASVNIIATLKSVLEESDNENTQEIITELSKLQESISTASSEEKLLELKTELGTIFKFLQERSESLGNRSVLVFEEIQKLAALLQALEINEKFDSVQQEIKEIITSVVAEIENKSQIITTLNEAGVSRALNEISTSAESLASRLTQAQNEIGILCEKNFSSVFERVTELKALLAQVDENSVSANNAIFSSITDRLSIFETGLRESLELQEKTVLQSSAQLVEQIENIKNISNVLDYKLDSSVVEAANVKKEFAELKSSVENVLALDFTNVVKDLRIDLYAVKQEMANSFENSSSELTERFTSDLYGKYELLISKIDSAEEELKKTQANSLANLKGVLEKISSSIVDVISYVSERKTTPTEESNSKYDEIINLITDNNINYVESLRDIVDVIRIQVETNIKSLEEETANSFDNVKKVVSENSEDIKKEIKYSYSKLIELQDSYNELQQLLNLVKENDTLKFTEMLTSTNNVKVELESKLDALKNAILDNVSEFKTEFTCENTDKISEIKFSVETLYNKNAEDIASLLKEMRESLTKLSADEISARTAALAKINDNFASIKDLAFSLQDKNTDTLNEKINSVIENISIVKESIKEVDENIDGDMSRQLSIIEGNFESLVSQLTILFDKSEISLTNKVDSEFSRISNLMQEQVENKLEGYKDKIESVFEELKSKALEQSDYLQDRIAGLHETLKEVWAEQSKDNSEKIEDLTALLKHSLDENNEFSITQLTELRNNLDTFLSNLELKNTKLSNDLTSQIDQIAQYINSILETQAKDSEERQSEINTALSEISNILEKSKSEISAKLEDFTTNNKEENTKNNANISTKLEELKVSNIDILTKSNTELVSKLENELTKTNTEIAEKLNDIKTFVSDNYKDELIAIDAYVDTILKQIELQKSNILSCKDLILEAFKAELGIISTNVEKETDIILAEIIEQFDLLKKSQADDIVNITSRIEDIINSQVIDGIEDLKSYLDIKTDNSVLNAKFDNLKVEMTSGVDSIIENISRLLDSSAFISSMSDFKLANEILINNAIENLNSKFEDFVKANTEDNQKINDKITLFDKKFAENLVEQFEEIKLFANSYNSSYEKVQESISKVFVEFDFVKQNVSSEINAIANLIKDSATSTNSAINKLNDSFESLKNQIANKSFEESFQTSLNKQITEIESLINEQMSHIEDIEDVCMSNLPDVAEMNTLLKNSILNSLSDLNDKMSSFDLSEQIENELKQLKSDVITQFLNIFNQISFVVEQEEIIDFIQEKHDELITILSHIVTTAENVKDVKNNVNIVDTKIDSLKEEIDTINEKITAIISSDGDIDYIYSLQDLEADIANLRIVLKEMKDGGNNFADLISSTEDIYKLVETIKTELPSKQDFNDIAEDIVSISTRTNKLILASDESYKNLQDNLQDFRIVINDLDERTRNFAKESGLDRIDVKLNSLNNMMQSGAKTNQVFNQVFEYLAEWVDNASTQINSISNKVETLDDIGQIKAILMDIKEGADDNSESTELVEALGTVFDKQTKRISALETKLDKIIVETTINNKNNKLDLSPFESTLNRFLVAIDEKMTEQQTKIEALEAKLANVIEEKDTQLLTKKVGGMDRQIAKLNKSIEKIASYVVEK